MTDFTLSSCAGGNYKRWTCLHCAGGSFHLVPAWVNVTVVWCGCGHEMVEADRLPLRVVMHDG